MKLGGSDLNGIVDLEEGYQLRPVSGSNAFIILKKRRPNDEDKCCDVKVYHQIRFILRRQVTSVVS